MHASVAEWSIATDCKSVALWATKVRILPGAQIKKTVEKFLPGAQNYANMLKKMFPASK